MIFKTIRPINGTLTDITTPSHRGSGNDGNKGVLYILPKVLELEPNHKM